MSPKKPITEDLYKTTLLCKLGILLDLLKINFVFMAFLLFKVFMCTAWYMCVCCLHLKLTLGVFLNFPLLH